MLKNNKLNYLFLLSSFLILSSCSNKSICVNKRCDVKSDSDINDSIANTTNNSFNQQNLDYENIISNLSDRIQSLEDKILHKNSLNSEISHSSTEDITLIEKSYKDFSKNSSSDTADIIFTIDKNEFDRKYIESLRAFQNAQWSASLEGFKFLLSTNFNIDLLDNCQYWIAENYYKLKKIDKALDEFKKVLLYTESDKRDDSLYKMAKCYHLMGNNSLANLKLQTLIEYYPNSEYINNAKKIVN